MDNWVKEWGEFAENIDQEIFKWIKEGFSIYKDEAINLNKQQLSTGRDTTGKNLSPYSGNSVYSPSHKRSRIKRGLPIDRKTLDYEGNHYAKFYALAFDKFLEMGSKDRKSLWLENDYPNIYGIPDEKLDSFLETYIWPHCAKRLIDLAESIQ